MIRPGRGSLAPVDAPLGEQAEKYSVSIDGNSGSFEMETRAPAIAVSNEQLGAAGSGPATLTIRQIGDWAVSHPAQLTITLP